MSEYRPNQRNTTRAYYPLDINQFVSQFLRSLQDRNTKAASETAIGSMIINSFQHFVIGSGLEPQSSPENSILKWTEEVRSKFMTQAESLFRAYASSKRIDFYGKNNFNQLQSIAFRNCLVDGDALMHRSYRRKTKDSNYDPFVQILSGRWVRNPYGKEDTKELIGGVRFDRSGREIGYYIAQTSDNLADSFDSIMVSKINARTGFEEYDLIRLDLREANQVRGIPVLTPVLEDIFDLETFKAAYKSKAATQALFTGVITSEKDAPTPAVSTMDTIRGLTNTLTEEDYSGEVNDIQLGTGNIIQLAPGEKFEMAESKVPATDFGQFVESELSHITAGTGNGGIAYEMVLQKYNNNYSASRATIAGQEKKFDNLRSVFEVQFCNPIWKQVIDWGIRTGRIEAPGYLEGDWMYKDAVLACTWIGPAPINIDPKKEVEAHIIAINAGLETKEQACRELFQTDYEETVERLKRETDLESNVLGKQTQANMGNTQDDTINEEGEEGQDEKEE